MFVIEWVQLGSAAIGMTLCGIGIVMAFRDLNEIRLSGKNGLYALAAAVRRRREMMRFVKHTVMFVGGVIVVDWRLTQEVWPQSWAIYYTRNLTMTFVSVLMMCETIWEQYDRWVIGRMVESESQRHGGRRTGDAH